MESNIEVESYEETIGNLNSNTPVVSRPSSSDQVSSVHPFQEPIYRTELEDFSCSTANLWPDPLMSHARQTQVPQKLGGRNNGAQSRGQNGDIEHRDFTYQKSTPAPASALDNLSANSVSPKNDRPSSAPSWMSTITAQVNALWQIVHGRSTGTAPLTETTEKDSGREVCSQGDLIWIEDERNKDCQDLSGQVSDRRLRHFDSVTVVNRRDDQVRTQANPETTRVRMLQQNSANDHDYDGRRESSSRRRERSAERQTSRRTESTHRQRGRGEKGDSTQQPRQSEERSTGVNQGKQVRHSSSSRRRQRAREDGSSSDNDSDDSSDNEHRRQDKGRKKERRPKRKNDPSPSDDNDDDDSINGSSSEEDQLNNSRKRYRMKLQTFDGTGSWESWWAHFQNCASYNRWNEHDKLAFVKGALTGNAAQVLWDTDQKTTNTLKKLVSILKSRYSGERQAEKYRAELQIRRRKPHESLSELHQDIRRLMALAYPKLAAEAREEFACDHFTNAFGDSELALKVKERTPRTLDEALRIALRLEAWAKNAKQERQEEDRIERSKNKARTTAKAETTRTAQESEAKERLTKLENQITQIHEELKKLTVTPTASKPLHTQSNLLSSSFQKPEAQATASAEESPMSPLAPPFRPATGNPRPLPYQPPFDARRQPPTCWACGLPGYISRACSKKMNIAVLLLIVF